MTTDPKFGFGDSSWISAFRSPWVEEEILPEAREITKEMVFFNGQRLLPNPAEGTTSDLPNYSVAPDQSPWRHLSLSQHELIGRHSLPFLSFAPRDQSPLNLGLGTHWRFEDPTVTGYFGPTDLTMIASAIHTAGGPEAVQVYVGDFFGTNKRQIALVAGDDLRLFHVHGEADRVEEGSKNCLEEIDKLRKQYVPPSWGASDMFRSFLQMRAEMLSDPSYCEKNAINYYYSSTLRFTPHISFSMGLNHFYSPTR